MSAQEPDIDKIAQAYESPELVVAAWSLLEAMFHGDSSQAVIDECWRRGIHDEEQIAFVLTIMTKFSAMTVIVASNTTMSPDEFARGIRLADKGSDSDAP